MIGAKKGGKCGKRKKKVYNHRDTNEKSVKNYKSNYW